MRHKDGNYRYVLDRGVVQRDRAGKVIRWIGSTTDITAEKTAIAEQKRVEEAL
ncbi:MAG: PAS domain-containing protein, partial [Methylacidiphilales bacterium]|nr:PAS domain-containing protein [Candidatus Methylacidiphilales bacterium]